MIQPSSLRVFVVKILRWLNNAEIQRHSAKSKDASKGCYNSLTDYVKKRIGVKYTED